MLRNFLTLVLLVAAVALAGAARAGAVDLRTGAAAEFDGAALGDAAGSSVASAGDVNGDGSPDLVVGAPLADNNVRSDSGSAYVLFGPTAGSVDLAGPWSGFRIDGAALADRAGFAVAGAGDVNCDGRDDVIVGAPQASNNDRFHSGSAYVIFGKASSYRVDLRGVGLTAAGFRIDGADAGFATGTSVAGAGDVNGDGCDDVVVGAPHFSFPHSDGGAAFVVFGKPTIDAVDLRTLGTAGFRIDADAAGEELGTSVAGAGDVDHDGVPDVLVGAPFAGANGRAESGSAFVVRGKATTTRVDLTALPGNGFRIDGAADGDHAGFSVGATDVDADGYGDPIVGAPGADPDGRTGAGAAYVVHDKGTSAAVDLAALGTDAYRIEGAAVGDGAGGAVAGAGDVDADGRGDVLVGAPFVDANSRTDSGSSYVVYGTGTEVDLAALGRDGFAIDGAVGFGHAGSAVAGAGDTNADGAADVLVGAPRGALGHGAAYVVQASAPGSRWGYVWANDPTAASYVPSHGYQRNSAGLDNRIARTATGAYTVTFPGLGSVGGTADVTAYGSGSEHCKIQDWRIAGADLDLRVLCFSAGGAPVDAKFTAAFTRPVGGTRWGYVWANLAGNPSYTPDVRYQGNSTGGTNTVTRISPGNYEVTLPGLGGPGGAVHVTAYGSGSESCYLAVTGTVGADETVKVVCKNATGVNADAQFALTFYDDGGLLGTPPASASQRAFVHMTLSTNASYTPGPTDQYSSAGTTNTVTRASVGVYTVHLPWLGVSGGHAAVTSQALWGARRCKVARWYQSLLDELVDVRCFDVAGAPVDDAFYLSFLY